ncbi:MAG: LLM class flavin-dependent oxidoreductase [Proteobacteria bacterium]|nr:MAG: LLM class flavin-dependent oxidoreductase [Pseudomonadota bacterium]
MRFDVFFSICQTPVEGYTPSERVMFENFFSQAELADELGFGTAWVAETHLSCQVQKLNPGAVIPHFKGEIGLNTDILQLAHLLFARTKKMHVGSAIRNIQCNGGPIAHAEAVRTFLTLHSLSKNENRILDLGFASGRFPFSNAPYGVRPRNPGEESAWGVLKGKIFKEATEVFLRFLKGEVFSAREVAPIVLRREDFRSDEDWARTRKAYGTGDAEIQVAPFWEFDQVGVIPFEAPLDLLRLTIGAHDLPAQIFANQFLPCGVFNLSITPAPQIEATHEAMKRHFHPLGGPWTRAHMPRTVLTFLDENPARAREKAVKAMENYWRALEGTLDPEKVKNAVDNALVGSPSMVAEEMKKRFHADDRLMLWFDFNNHDNDDVKRSMRAFMEKVAPKI